MANQISPQKRNLQNYARQKRAIREVEQRFITGFASNKPLQQAVTAGRNQVQIDGAYYPAEGVEGQGGSIAVVNVGTPAVAKYAPANTRSVVGVAGSGRGGGDNSGGGSGMVAHDLSGPYHTGTLSWSLVNKSGSSLSDIATRPHSALTGIGPNDHHNQQHALVGSDHTASGLTTGYVIRATGTNTFAWQRLQHNDLDGVTPNQHHNQVHNIVGSDHTLTASQWQLVGATATNTLGLLTPSSNPGAAAAILRTDSNGGLQLDTTLFVVDAANNLVTMDTNLFYLDADNNRIGVNTSPGNAALDLRAAANADHTQRIRQRSGQIGRLWRIEDVAGDELIVLDSQGNLQSGKPGFVSGLTGWQITPQGTAEFNNVFVRGELHATVFVKDEVHVSGGTILVATGAKLYSDAVIDSVTMDVEDLYFETEDGLEAWEVETQDGTEQLQMEAILNEIEIEDSPTGPGFYFQPGDIIRSKTEVPTGVTDFWLEIIDCWQESGYQRYGVYKHSGTDGTLPAGSGVGSYGKVGDGRILLTSDLNYAPYIDVFTVGPEPWTGDAGSIVPHVRLGRLDGLGLPSVSGIEQYGIAAATDGSNANSPYLIASNLGLRVHKANITLNNGTNDTGLWDSNGNLTLGSNIANDAGKSFSVTTTGTNAGYVIIGDHELEDNYILWDGETLHVRGDLLIDNPGYLTEADLATSPTIINIESDIDTLVNIGIPLAQSAAQTYANARRVLGVSGTFTSTNPSTGVVDNNTIYWVGVQVRFGDGGVATINNGNTGNMTQRTYLYIAAGTNTTVNMSQTTNIAALNTSDVLIAVCNPGTDGASVQVVGGGTYISGDNIVTGTIVSAHIKAGAVTADHIWVNNSAVLGVKGSIRGNNKAYGSSTPGFFLGYDGGTYKFDIGNSTNYLRYDGSNLTIAGGTGDLAIGGSLIVGTSGSVYSSGKTYGGSASGFFLGYNGGQYRFDVGNNNSYIRWTGTTLQFQTEQPITFSANAQNDVLVFSGAGNAIMKYGAEGPGILSYSNSFRVAGNLIASGRVIIEAWHLQINTPRTIASSGTFGIQGEWCWDENYIYVYTGSQWKRATLNTF